MPFEEAREAMEQGLSTTPVSDTSKPEGGESLDTSSNGSLAPDSSASQSPIDLSKAGKFLWDGKEMTPEELRKSILRQQDYTKKTQAHAEERRKFEEERRQWQEQQEMAQKYEQNFEIDIQNVLKDPSMEARFREIYPAKYHAALEQALVKAFGDPNSPKRNESLLEQRLRSVETKFQAQERERAAQAFETEVSKNAEILDSNIQRLSQKYPSADEDSVLARAEHMAASLKKDASFNKNFSDLMEKLYKENHDFHEKRYAAIYKEKVEKQKQANTRAKDVGRGGATPGTAPAKMKLKDVKHHILSQMGQN
jgi:hypothetical protein